MPSLVHIFALGLLFGLAFTACDDDDESGGDTDGGGSAAGGDFDCDTFAATNCDPACECGEGDTCAIGNGGDAAVTFEDADECLGFYRVTCESIVEMGAGDQLAAQFAQCARDLENAECGGEAIPQLVSPESCQS